MYGRRKKVPATGRRGHKSLSAEQREFLLKEWEQTREQVHLLLQAIWRFEAASILGLAAFYAWYFARLWPAQGAPIQDMPSIWITLVPALFATAICHRLLVEYRLLMRLAEYCRTVEKRVYDGVGSGRLGFERFLAIQPPDIIKSERVYARYRNTFIVFHLIALGTWVLFGYSVFEGWDELIGLIKRG